MEKKHFEIEKKKFHLANERTFLSYVRTAASILVLAIALYRFFDSKMVMAIATICLVVGFLIIFLGFYRYATERKRINEENID